MYSLAHQELKATTETKKKAFRALMDIAERGIDPRTLGLWAQHGNNCDSPVRSVEMKENKMLLALYNLAICRRKLLWDQLWWVELVLAHDFNSTNIPSHFEPTRFAMYHFLGNTHVDGIFVQGFTILMVHPRLSPCPCWCCLIYIIQTYTAM